MTAAPMPMTAAPMSTVAAPVPATAAAQWTPPAKVHQTQSMEPSASHNRSETPTPQPVTEEEGASTPRPTVTASTEQSTVQSTQQKVRKETETIEELSPELVSRPEVAPRRPAATGVSPDRSPNKPLSKKEESQKTWGANSVVSSPVPRILNQSAATPQYHHEPPFKVAEPLPMRPSTPVQPVSLPTFEEYASYQPSFMVAGTVYVHRSEDPYPEDLKPDEEVYAPPESAYIAPFTAPQFEWDATR